MDCSFIGWCGLTQEAQAAWAQAVLSALAIIAAWWLANRQERRALARKVDVYVNLISMAESRSGAIALFTPGDVAAIGTGKSISDYQISDFEQFADAFRSIALQDLPDYRLLPVLRDAQSACEVLVGLLRTVTPQDAASLSDAAMARMASIRHCQVRLSKAYAEAAVVANEYSMPTLGQRVRYAAFKLRSWRRGKH